MSKAKSVAEAIKQGLDEATALDLLSRVEAVEVLEEVQRYIEEKLEELLSEVDDLEANDYE